MDEMRRHGEARRFAGALLFDTDGNLLLQRRDNKSGILHPGRIGLFGGHQEADESPLECVVREVHEELSYFIPPHRFKRIGTYTDESTGSRRIIELFMANALPVSALIVTEGTLMIVPCDEVAALKEKLTPSAAAALNYCFSGRAPY
jgi:8-oxo-dGTP pyrophosphatase MutT (NUDIX family)